jgi:putative endonuclease
MGSCGLWMVRQMSGMSRYFVYMLRCFDGTFYTGVTNDIDRRYEEHCSGHNRTCYTYTRRPLRLAYVGEFSSPDEAIAFEKRLKGWSHKKKRAFAERDWTLLKRLAVGRRAVRALQ